LNLLLRMVGILILHNSYCWRVLHLFHVCGSLQ
jgi:hypothetical protein